MNPSPSRRVARLLDARAPDRPLVAAEVLRGLPSDELDTLETVWGNARQRAATDGQTSEAAVLEHAHWDWRNKAEGVESGRYLLVAVVCAGDFQGVMAIRRAPRPARLGDGHVVYVDYLESAPWNLKGFADPPRFLGVGTVLLADAVRLSTETGHGGRVGLHSLPQAEPFYARFRMTRAGPDPDYYDLTYFEYTEQQATDWLASLGEVQ
jgi:hypothetical protein